MAAPSRRCGCRCCRGRPHGGRPAQIRQIEREHRVFAQRLEGFELQHGRALVIDHGQLLDEEGRNARREAGIHRVHDAQPQTLVLAVLPHPALHLVELLRPVGRAAAGTGRGTAATGGIDPSPASQPASVAGLHQRTHRARLLQLDPERQAGLGHQRMEIKHLHDRIEIDHHQHPLHVGQTLDANGDRHVHRVLGHLGRQHLDARVETDRRIRQILSLKIRPAYRIQRIGIRRGSGPRKQPCEPAGCNPSLH